MKKYIFLSLILVSFLSCIKTIDFNDEQYANQLILNSIIWPDSAFQASLSKSTSILENDYGPVYQIPDGAMDIYENNQLLAHLSSSTGKFRAANIKPKAGNTYRLVATSQGKQIEAETIIPLKAEVVSIDTSLVKNNSYQKTLFFDFKIKDTPGEDYYRIVLEYEYLAQITSRDINNKEIKIYQLPRNINWGKISDDPVFKSVYSNSGGEIFDMAPDNRYNIFPDDIFNGKERSIQVKANFTTYNLQNYGNIQTIYDRFTLHIQHISKDLYNYLKYLELYDYYHENPISEPVPVYSNIKNGAGIFAGFNDDASYTFEKVYIPYSMDTIKIEGSPGYGGYVY
ncbi:MAG TPA: DUF4249 domain-containing protein [Prolixibacteraceae bacterium]|nr:DUF4249 domain-containing protein [Prolixibacteraceae bacterium]